MSPFRRLWPFVRPYGRAYLLGAFFLMLTDGLQLVIPRVMKVVLNGIESYDMPIERLWTWCGAIVGLALGVALFRYLWRQQILVASHAVARDLRREYFAHLLRLSSAYFDRAKTGDLMARATNDMNAIRMLCGFGFTGTFDAVVLFSAALLCMISISPRLTLFALAPLPLLSLFILWIGKRLHDRFESVQEGFSTLSETVEQNVAGIRVVKDFAHEELEIEHFAEVNDEYARRNLDLAKCFGGMHVTVVFLVDLAFALVLYFGGTQVLDRSLSLGEFVAFVAYLDLVIWPMIAIGWVTNLIQRGKASMARIARVLDTPPQIVDPEPEQVVDLEDEPPGELALAFEGLSFSYEGEGEAVLRDVDLAVPRGSMLGVVGPTGSGKSSLLALWLRLYEAPEGTVLVEGRDIRSLRLEQLRRRIAVVPQDVFLFSGPLRANLLFSGEGLGEERMRWAARQAGIAEEIEAMSDGYETVIGERGVSLSGGQRQRVAIARALVMDAPILLLDDCLSAVDTRTERRILENLRAYRSDRTTVVVSNRIAAIQEADQIVVLDEGRIVERGDHARLVVNGGIYADLHRRQQLEDWIETH